MLHLTFRFLLLLASLYTIISLVGCNKKSDENKPEKDEKKTDLRIPVEVESVGEGLIESYIEAFANLEAESNVQVIARTAELVDEINVEEGDEVKKGALLAKLNNNEQLISLQKVSSSLEKDASEFKRQETLKSRNLVSDKGFADAKNSFKQSQLDKSRAQLEYDYTFIKAPIKGTVTERLIKLGDKVKLNDHLFTIVDFDTIVARIFLPEETLPKLRVGQLAIVRSQSLPDYKFEGTISRISPVIDPRTGTVKVTVSIRTKNLLKPGMYVNTSILTDVNTAAVRVPKKALVFDDEQTFVYVVRKHKVKRVFIKTKLSDTLFVEPDTGIEVGDRLVIAGQNSLKDDASIRIVREDGIAVEDTKSKVNIKDKKIKKENAQGKKQPKDGSKKEQKNNAQKKEQTTRIDTYNKLHSFSKKTLPTNSFAHKNQGMIV